MSKIHPSRLLPVKKTSGETEALSLMTGSHIMEQEWLGVKSMQYIYVCRNCGMQNSPSQRFCAGCGAQLATFCPYCSADMAPASRFCTSCGQYLGWDQQLGWNQQQGWGRQQLVKEHKATSGWAKFGNFLFAVGVLCVVIGPIVLLLRPSSAHTATSLIQVIAAGAVCIFIGLPLMSKR